MYPIRTTQGISLPLIALIAAISASLLSQQAMAGYRQENLVSNIPGLAAYTDPNLVNPWGISSSPVGPFWVSDNGTGLSTIYNTSGIPQGLVVTVPPPPPGSPVGTVAKPTGQVFNSNVTAFPEIDLFSPPKVARSRVGKVVPSQQHGSIIPHLV